LNFASRQGVFLQRNS